MTSLVLRCVAVSLLALAVSSCQPRYMMAIANELDQEVEVGFAENAEAFDTGAGAFTTIPPGGRHVESVSRADENGCPRSPAPLLAVAEDGTRYYHPGDLCDDEVWTIR